MILMQSAHLHTGHRTHYLCTEGRDTSTGRVTSVLRSPDAWGTRWNKQPPGSRVNGLSARISMT